MPLTSIIGSLRGAVRKLLGGGHEPAAASGRPSSQVSAPTAFSPPPQRIPSSGLAKGRAAQMPPASKAPATTAPMRAPSALGLTWIGPGRTIKHGGFDIRDPLAYFCAGDSNACNDEPAAVDLRLPVAGATHEPFGGELPYWSRYDEFSPEQRRVYLEWLARGRMSVPPEVGYAFVFLYGLERRALEDRQDVKLIFKEVLRLRELYARSGQPTSRSFDTYTSSFLWFLLLRESAVFATRHFEVVGKATRAWDEDRLALALAWLAAAGQALPDWLAFALAGQLPKSQRSVVVKRVGDEMRELFSKRYRDLSGDGMALKTSKRDRKYSYRPASAALPPFEAAGPNPMGTSSQFNKLGELWNDCIADLKRLSSVVADAGGGEEMTVETWNALPAELQAGADHPLADQFTRFIEEHTADSAHTIAPARALATLSGIPADAKLTAAACRRVGDIVDNVGYCVEPDARLTGRSYDADGSVIIFLNLADGTTDPNRYAAASTLLSVGLALAQIDGRSDEGELSLLTQHIDSAFELNEHEQRRLSMLRALLVAKGADLSDVTKPLKRLPQAERERVAKFALALVAADGVVTKDELKAVRRLYSAMGFERDQADAAIAALTKPANDDEPVTVLQAGMSTPGELIPPAPRATAATGLKLDRAAIAAILKDTLEVSRMLADAMSIDAQQATHDSPGPRSTPSLPEPVQIAIAAKTAVDPSVPARYAAFYQVIVTRSQWSRADLSALAKQHGLMLAGAVEAINDWSTGKHGGPLLYEDDQHFTLESAYMN